MALNGRKTNLGLNDLVICWFIAVRSLDAKPADGDIDQMRVQASQVFATKTKTVHYAGTIIAENNIGVLNQLFNDSLALV